MLQRTRDYADAIKDVEPNAIVLGPVNYGSQGMVNFQGAGDAGTLGDFLNCYLSQLNAESTCGQRLVDVLDMHWYSEAGANNSGGNWTRITEDSTDPNVVAARLQAPRSLWDTTCTENSWISQWSTPGPTYLLPRLQTSDQQIQPAAHGGHSRDAHQPAQRGEGVPADQRQKPAAARQRHEHHSDQRFPAHHASLQRDHDCAQAMKRGLSVAGANLTPRFGKLSQVQAILTLCGSGRHSSV